MKTILDLCGGTGSWSKPYKEAGYRIILVDTLTGNDVRTFEPPQDIQGILAAPPCTEFAGSGARWWKDKPPELLEEATEIVRACLRIIDKSQPTWWALENPVGRLTKCVPELGKWKYTFQPCEFGHPWTKRTCIWGEHNEPGRGPFVEPDPKNSPWYMPPGPQRQMLRSITPEGFARAFFRANP